MPFLESSPNLTARVAFDHSVTGCGNAALYDAMTAAIPYWSWVDYMEDLLFLFDRHRRARRVLDLACGTGRFSAAAAKRGYWVRGVDASPAMLEIYRERLAREGACYWQAQMARFDELPANGAVDVAVCWFDALNYELSTQRLSEGFRRVRASLAEGGLFIFDLVTDAVLQGGSWGNSGSFRMASGELCQYTQELRSVCLPGVFMTSVQVRDVHGGAKSSWKYLQRVYDLEWVRGALGEADFDQVVTFNAFSLVPESSSNPRVTVVARAAVN